MKKEDIKKVLTKVINSENNAKKGKKSNTLKVADIKTGKTIHIQVQTI